MGNSTSVAAAAGADTSVGVLESIPSHHLPNGTFTIPWAGYQEVSFLSFFREARSEGFHSKMREMQKKWLSMSEEELQKELPIVRRTVDEWRELFFSSVNSSGADAQDFLRATWVGHSTFVVQMGNHTILTDPVFSDRASMVQWAGPKRVRETPFTVEQLAETGLRVDTVLISHNHYDHLDYAAVMDIHKHWPQAKFFVPLKLKSWFTSCGIPQDCVVEMDWWEHADHRISLDNGMDRHVDSRVHFVPMQHWSSRRGYDRNWTLWGGFVVEDMQSGRKVFFSGDTGYCHVFREVGDKYGPMDLALIPIGAYAPRSIMRSQHINPQEAVQMALDVKAKRCIGMHWGTFVLTIEEVTEPRELLREEVLKVGKPEHWFTTLHHGGTLEIDKDGKSNAIGQTK